MIQLQKLGSWERNVNVKQSGVMSKLAGKVDWLESMQELSSLSQEQKLGATGIRIQVLAKCRSIVLRQ